MKEAMWGIGLIMLSVITFVVIGTVTNVTTTNQQDYEYMKNTVEAAMYDAVDEVKYRKGICVCTAKTGSPITFDGEGEYSIKDPDEDSECTSHESNGLHCQYLHGEYVIDSDVFVESLVSRFATVAKNQEKYEILVQDVIAYPPKASVRITYYQNMSDAISDDPSHPIINQMDAILEGGKVKVEPSTSHGPVKLQVVNCDGTPASGNITITSVDRNVHTTKDGHDLPYTVASGTTVELYVASYTATHQDSSGATISVPFTVDKNDINETQLVDVQLGNCSCNGALTVLHLNKADNSEVCKSETNDDIKDGDTYKTSGPCNPGNDLVFDSIKTPLPEGASVDNQNVVTGTIKNKQRITIIYYYKETPKHMVIVKHLDSSDSSKEVCTKETYDNIKVGATKTVSPCDLANNALSENYKKNYQYDKVTVDKAKSHVQDNSTKNVTVTMSDDNVTVTYYYNKKGSSGGGNCKWFYSLSTPHMCKDDAGGTVMKYDGGGYSAVKYDKSGDALSACKIAACGSAKKYASGCTAYMGFDYQQTSTSAKLHHNDTSSSWCSGKGYYSCHCVNKTS